MLSAVAFSSAGGWLGSVHIRMVTFHSPMNGGEFLVLGSGLAGLGEGRQHDLGTGNGLGVIRSTHAGKKRHAEEQHRGHARRLENRRHVKTSGGP